MGRKYFSELFETTTTRIRYNRVLAVSSGALRSCAEFHKGDCARAMIKRLLLALFFFSFVIYFIKFTRFVYNLPWQSEFHDVICPTVILLYFFFFFVEKEK